MKDSKKILINASNLHTGGCIQVATSFLYDLSKNKEESKNFDVIASSEVLKNLNSTDFDKENFSSVEEYNVYGIRSLKTNIKKIFDKYDIIFTVFGPTYVKPQKKTKHIMGFAQLWITNPKNEIYINLSIKDKIKKTLEYKLKEYFYTQADVLIVEGMHVKNSLSQIKKFKEKDIFVVENRVSSVFLNKDLWMPPQTLPQKKEKISLGLVSRDYPHKNLSCLPKVKESLLKNYDLDIDFYVTLNESEWLARDDQFRSNIKNIGPLKISECPIFYNFLDGVIFPSYLECFSATPIEAIFMNKPVFASNREFVKEFCGDTPFYFEPTNIESISNTIANYFHNETQFKKNIKIKESLFDSQDRTRKYLEIIKKYI